MNIGWNDTKLYENISRIVITGLFTVQGEKSR